METLAMTYAYAAYEQNAGMEFNFSACIPLIVLKPQRLFLAYLGIFLFIAQCSVMHQAIAHSTLFPQPIQGATVNTPSTCLNIRVVPNGDIVTCLKKGTVLKNIVLEENGWYQLASGKWVRKDYVKLPTAANPAPAPQSTAPWQDLKYVEGKLMQGEKVKILQTKLNYYKLLAEPLAVDGYFGKRTKLAVEAYQQQRGLKMDGIVGETTRKALGL